MNRYSEYKESGIEWVGEVPEHWNTHRLKEITSKLEQGWSPNAATWPADEGEYGVLKLSAISGGKFIESENKELAEHTSSGQLEVSSGVLLITRSNTPSLVGECCPVNHVPYTNLIVPDLIFAITPSLRLTSLAFLAYQMNSASFRWLKRVTARGLNDSMVKISQGTIKNWRLLTPPLPEQTAIAAYLDTKTAQIDRQIDLLSQKATQYGNLKQSLINETVIRGLDKSVPMKDSGVEWIGEVPEHWEVKRILDVANLYNGNSLNDTLKERYFDNSIPCLPYIGTKDINASTYKADFVNGVYIPNSEAGYKKAPINSTLLCIEGGSAGKKMTFVRESVCFVNKLLCFAVNSRTHPLYLHYFVRSTQFASKFNTCLTGLKDNYWGVTGQEIRRFSVPIPPITEQQKIAEYLDGKNTQIDKIVASINTQMDKLKDLRKALINDVVTGKIKVVSEGQAA